MKDHLASGEHVERIVIGSELREPFDGRTILVVEDDPDVRGLLLALFEMAGYVVTASTTAEAALDALRQETFDIVLTDYTLPNRSGGWLLQQARAEGRLDEACAIVVTAHPEPDDVQGFEVVRKPFDLDDLVAQVRVRLEGSSGRSAGRMPRALSSGRTGWSGGDDCPEPIELILYVTAGSTRTPDAIEDIKRVLSRNGSRKFNLTICDVQAAAAAAVGPTGVVRQAAGPRTRIVGHITNPGLLAELLEECHEP